MAQKTGIEVLEFWLIMAVYIKKGESNFMTEPSTSMSRLLADLRTRIYRTNGQLSSLDRGKKIAELFPEEAKETIHLADEAMRGMLILPGTGPEPVFTGNPPRWTDNPVKDNEYTFHLNRMHHLKTMSEAYSLTGDLKYAHKVIEEMTDWMDHIPCPALERQNFEGLSPWRALETGIRGYRTWPLIIELLADTPYFDEAFLKKLLSSVEEHCKILYEISPVLWPKADHNHYLMENLGLLSFCCLFPELKDCQTWLSHAQRELDRCMEAQCTPCGGQIEGCPSYHNGCVFWFSMRLYFSGKFGLEVPETYTRQLEKMFRHSVFATRSCGGNFPWGDSHTVDKETMSLAAVSCYMAFHDPNYLKTALFFYPVSTIKKDIRDNLWRFSDIEGLLKDLTEASSFPKKPDLPLTAWQKDLNQVYARSGWEKEAVSFMTACRTPVQNLHAHMDPGGFDFTAFGEPLVSDPGIYTYKADENRYHFKSTLSHNCLTINKKDAWEYQGSWAYGPQKEGKLLSVTETGDLLTVVSRHENYAPASAVRILAFFDREFLLIFDMADHVTQKDSIEVNFHLNKKSVAICGNRIMAMDKGLPGIELLSCYTPETLEAEQAKISKRTNVWHDSTILRFQNHGNADGSFYHGVLLIPHKAGENAAAAKSFDLEKTADGFLTCFTVHEKHYKCRITDNQLIKE